MGSEHGKQCVPCFASFATMLQTEILSTKISDSLKEIIILKSFNSMLYTVKVLNIGTYMSEQTVYILIRLLLRSSLIGIYTVCHSVYIFWRHYCIVISNCFMLRTTMVVSLGVQIFRVFTVW